MAFQKMPKTHQKAPSAGPQITLSAHKTNGATKLVLSRALVEMLGEPVAIYFEWDPEDFLLRIVSSSPDDPAAYVIPKNRYVSVTGLFRQLGVKVTDTVRIPVEKQGRLAGIADLSDLPAAGNVHPIRGAA
ncbi:hypothetical protein C1N80_06320 [Brachybacterium sp. SGAir0954]|uniref:hypothetical protein n=1 Tax=Brachybacterium sp. SGAir0954 TaxID=2571029 RepID=UPI0010CD1306|nr:hypothetical protein [Brachybacterium sp. SGAir0954]QCR53235.1 hypothetical protein C1N80_06320 [Brachybacterium sp. SGAir0954]